MIMNEIIINLETSAKMKCNILKDVTSPLKAEKMGDFS